MSAHTPGPWSEIGAASEMEAALARLEYQHGHTTEAELAADDAALAPALVDGQEPPAIPQNISASGAGNFLKPKEQ